MILTILKKKGIYQNSNVYIDDVLVKEDKIDISGGVHKIVIEQAELTEHEYFMYKEYIWWSLEPAERHGDPEWKQYYTVRYTIEINITDDSYLSIEILPQHISEESKECFYMELNSDSSFTITSKENIIEKYSLKSMKRLKIIQTIFAIPIIIIVIVMIVKIIEALFY